MSELSLRARGMMLIVCGVLLLGLGFVIFYVVLASQISRLILAVIGLGCFVVMILIAVADGLRLIFNAVLGRFFWEMSWTTHERIKNRFKTMAFFGVGLGIIGWLLTNDAIRAAIPVAVGTVLIAAGIDVLAGTGLVFPALALAVGGVVVAALVEGIIKIRSGGSLNRDGWEEITATMGGIVYVLTQGGKLDL